MTYKYTKDGVFNGALKKEPPLPKTDPAVAKAIAQFKQHLLRRWLHNGCAVEEIGRFGYAKVAACPVQFSALVWHLQDLLMNPQPIANNDGYGPAGNVNGVKVFDSRFVTAALVDGQISGGMEDVLLNYLGFKLLVPYFSNTEKTYGDNSRIGLYGICCTRYLDKHHQPAGFNTEPTTGLAFVSKNRPRRRKTKGSSDVATTA